MEDLDNVKLISIFEAMAPKEEHRVTVTFNIDTASHLRARAVRVLVRGWMKCMHLTLGAWQLRTHRSALPAAHSSRRVFRSLKKPVHRPEYLETSEVWRVNIHREAAVHLQAASLKKVLGLFRHSLHLTFYQWKFAPAASSPTQQRCRPLIRGLIALLHGKYRTVLQQLSVREEAPKSESQLLDKSFEMHSEEKVSFGLDESLEIDPDDELHYLLGIDVKRLRMPKVMERSGGVKPDRRRLLAIVCCRARVRWFFAKKNILRGFHLRMQAMRETGNRREVKLQALVRGFLTRVHLRTKRRLQQHFHSPEMWLLVFAVRRRVWHSLQPQGEGDDLHSRVAYALKFKKLLKRVNCRRDMQRSNS